MFFYICIGILVFIMLILLMKITIKIDFIFDGKNTNFQIKVSILHGFIHKKLGLNRKSIEESQNNESLETKINFDSFFRNKYQFHEKMKYLFKQIYIQRVYWNTSVGTGDADTTGLTSGVLVGLKGMIIGILNMYFIFSDEIEMNVTPVYRGKGIYSELKIVFSFRIFRVMIAVVLLYLFWRRIQNEQKNTNFQFE